MCFPPETGEATTIIDGADVWADGLEGRESAALGFDLADDVFANGLTHVICGPSKPLALFLQQVGRHALHLGGEVMLMAAGLIERGNSLIDLVALDAGASFEAVGCGEFGLFGRLCLQEFAKEDVAVGEGFFGNKGVAAVVLEGVTERSGFGGALGGV